MEPIEELAEKAKGNWRKFGSFAWHARPDDAESFYIHHLDNRDSTLLAQSNADAIRRDLKEWTGAAEDGADVLPQHFSHWLCGWVDAVAIRVYRDGVITPAFRRLYDIMKSLEYYPVLDEEDYFNREYRSTISNINDAAWKLKREWTLPDGWEEQVFSWFWDNDQAEVQNTDDTGGYPSEEGLVKAFEALGYQKEEE